LKWYRTCRLHEISDYRILAREDSTIDTVEDKAAARMQAVRTTGSGSALLSVGKPREKLRPSVFSRAIMQLVGGLVFAVLLPWLVRALLDPDLASLVSQENAAIGTMVGVIAGHVFLRSLTSFPGIRVGNYVLPTFAISYGVVMAVFFFFRLDYSRLHFLGSFVLCAVWYLAILYWRRRDRVLTIGIVPAGEVRDLHDVEGAHWIPLQSPHARIGGLDAIVADLRADMSDDWERFLAESAIGGVPVYHSKQIQESLTGRVEIEHLSENNFGSLIPGLTYVTTKQIFDLVTAVVMMFALLVPGVLVGLAIKADSRGPVFFRQRRMGYRGEVFTVYKFRTMMHRNGDAPGDPRNSAITVEGDARITRLGKFLRRTRIDELPQILNIVRGEMSWIGPRPEAEVLSLWYEKELPFYRYRHIVRPGITGWAQVNQGHVANVDEVLWKLHYDFYYIKNFTPWLDMLIAFRTVHTVLTGFGSR